MKCRYCKLDKDNSCFAPSAFKEYSKGKVPRCRECSAKTNKAWRLANIDKVKAYQQKRRAVPDIKERDRIRSLKTKYGITTEQYTELLIQQEYKCAICGTTQASGRWNKLCVDHNHITGQVRELLCTNCNKGLGCFKDNIKFIREAELYLSKWQK